ncbi:MAG: hypothetical protein GY906_37300 [bacterium]|nr:hypothetical protein [bacterium]
MNHLNEKVRTGWGSVLARMAMAALLVEAFTGLMVTLAPFHAVVEWSLLAHTAIGLVVLVPLTIYMTLHWVDYQRHSLSDVVLVGYIAAVALLVCAVSGMVVTFQGLFALRMTPMWRYTHLVSTVVLLVMLVPHLVLIVARVQGRDSRGPAFRLVAWSSVGTAVALVFCGILAAAYSGPTYVNEFPEDYSFIYGEDRPFAPSLAVTASGGAYAPESMANSDSCGTAGCHSEILAEWKPSAHRYSAMDPLFQKVQSVMAEQNGPESTRYCGGCHDPISLFSGSKNLYSEELTDELGYQEGVSCLACHGVRETDLQGNANYVMTQPPTYLWQWKTGGFGKWASDFLIRSYPDQHRLLSKRMFKAPEYCAACHKQFIDEEVNRVGWVQLQNQYDNWKASHWFTEGDAERTVECRECHMPLVPSKDPAAGDTADYNRNARDGQHRSHRFAAANSMVPRMLELEGWEEHVRLTEQWLQGRIEIDEISSKWATGPVVELAIDVPEAATPGETFPVRVVMTANKVGHDFPTGPLDIIQSWVEISVVDSDGVEVFSSGKVDEKHFIEPGSFLFKAEPVDQYGNLIDRHNLWEMVGVRYRRAIFPGYSDTVEYLVDCPTTSAPGRRHARQETGLDVREFEVPSADVGELTITAILQYRKVDQFLINFLLGEDSGLTAPVVEMNRAEATVRIQATKDPDREG